ncbi:MAG: N-acetylmuramoyl-L-alanine amidase-like domain-containing protein [Armatimonadota bacterium]
MLGFLAAICIQTVPLMVDDLSKEAAMAGVYRQPIGKRMEFFARKFLGTPYVGATLDQTPNEEKCTVLLSGLDCVTFVETVFALARTPDPTDEKLRVAVTKTRYWGGRVDGYLSRLHYTTDWFFDNSRKGTITDLSAKLPGSVPMTRKVSYMSVHPDRYAALSANPDLLPRLRKLEAESNARKKWYIPVSALPNAEKQLRTGDIIGLVGGVKGIDITHVGLIVVEKGVPHFVHASSTKHKVTFDKRLSEYLSGSKTEGIIVARPR